jgi:hypothetical protein
LVPGTQCPAPFAFEHMPRTAEGERAVFRER